jgi:hypothetical protein
MTLDDLTTAEDILGREIDVGEFDEDSVFEELLNGRDSYPGFDL